MAIVVGIAFAGFATSLAAKTWLDFINLGHSTSNTRLRIECEGAEPYDELMCRITSYHVYKMPDDVRQMYRAQLARVDTATDSELDQLRAGNSREAAADDRARMAAATPEQRAAWADSDAVHQAFSRARTRSELKAAYADKLEMEESTCNIMASQSDPQTYHRVAPHRWEVHAGPSHHCHVSQVFSLENSAENAAAWTYSETVTAADSEGECSIWVKRVHKVDVYSGDPPNVITGCKYIVMGH